MNRMPFALQLYTVRDHLEKDVPGTLRKVRDMGYSNVEIAGTFGLTDAAFKEALERLMMKPMSIHTSYEAATSTPGEVAATAKLYGVKYAVVSSIDSKYTPNKAGWVACGQALDAAGAILRDAGIQLCYHNHAHEFQMLDREYPYDMLFGAARPENLAAQIDAFWVRYAGFNPVTIINKYSGRCPLLHVKDMADEKSRAFAEVGRGIINWGVVFEAAKNAGTQWYIVEQDACAGDTLASAAISADFMRQY